MRFNAFNVKWLLKVLEAWECTVQIKPFKNNFSLKLSLCKSYFWEQIDWAQPALRTQILDTQ